MTRRVSAGIVSVVLALTGTSVAPRGPAGLAAQSVVDRTPNVEGVWSAAPGRLHFHFVHRFDVTDPPARKVFNSPTFVFATGLFHTVDAGARYGTSSLLVPATPNELELFARWAPVSTSRNGPLDLGVQVAYNRAAESVDAELALARGFGPVRLMAAARSFQSFAGGDSEVAVVGGARWRLTDHVAVAGDVGGLMGVDEADAVWGAGLQMGIPYTPHSFSLHVSNANTTTLQGASIGAGDRRWGFEFTVPVTFSRYFGSGSEGAQAQDPSGDGQAAPAAVVEMDNRLRFLPDTIRIRVGEQVEWRNTSDLLHTVTADPERALRAENVLLPGGAEPFDSGDLAPGSVFRHTFTVAGTYQYTCVPHEPAGMVGVVIVE